VIRIGLTGSIGMGKSTVARMFEDAGVPVFDADAAVRRMQAEDENIIAAIGSRFPGVVQSGLLDRKALAERALGDPDALNALEAIIHPAVQAERARFIAAHRDAPALIFEIPLLFETGSAAQFDKIVTVSAPAAIQRDRVLERADMTEAKLEAILARQWPDADKRKRSDFVIETGGDLSTTEAQVRHILACLGLVEKR
jgi:dephospho-CoA kinase